MTDDLQERIAETLGWIDLEYDGDESGMVLVGEDPSSIMNPCIVPDWTTDADEALKLLDHDDGLICSLSWVSGGESVAKYGFTISTRQREHYSGYGATVARAICECWMVYRNR